MSGACSSFVPGIFPSLRSSPDAGPQALSCLMGEVRLTADGLEFRSGDIPLFLARHLASLKSGEHPEVAGRWQDACRQARRQKEAVRFEYSLAVPEQRTLSATVSPAGEHYTFLVDDVTRHQEAEAHARHLGRMYVALSKTNRAVAFCYDRDALLGDVCTIATDYSGFPAASVMLINAASGAMDLAAYSGPPGVQGVLSALHSGRPLQRRDCRKWQTVLEGKPYVCQGMTRCLDRSISTRLRCSAIFPLRVEGEVVGAFTVYGQTATDFHSHYLEVLTEMAAVVSFGLESLEREQKRRQAEVSLRESQNMLSRLMDLVPLVIHLYDVPSRRTLYVNRAIEAITGQGADEILALDGHFAATRVHPDDRSALEGAVEAWRSVREGEVVEYDCRIASRQGGWCPMNLREVVVSRAADGQPQQVLGVATDMSVALQMRREEERQQADFSRMGRLVTVGEMASALAHEINQPLSAIANFTQACLNLKRDGRLSPGEIEQILEKIAAQALRAGEVLQTVRNFVRKREVCPGAYDINQIIGEVLGLARIRSSDQPLTLVLREGLPAVRVDRILVLQVLMNLLRNAEESMGDGAGQAIEIGTARQGDESVRVWVRDRGRGLPEGFDLGTLPSFYTTKPDGMGVGLGICRNIIEANGGRLWAEREPQGTVFHFTLPVA